MLELGLKFTVAFCLGSILGSLLLGHFHSGADLRDVGSRNPGATNALRTHGKAFALGVMIVDVGKGIAAVLIIPGLALPGIGIDPEINRALILYSVAFAAILGHVFPVWHDFHGGKGGATAFGVICCLTPLLAGPVIGLWVLLILLTGLVGLATILATVGAAALIGVTRLPAEPGLFVFACVVAVLITYTHRSNIRRMLDGTEAIVGQPLLRRK